MTLRRSVIAVLIALLALLAAACASAADAPGEPTPVMSARTTRPPATPTPTPSATPTPGATAVPQPSDRSITISAVGDVSLARQVVERMEASGASYPFELIAPLVRGDIAIANLEGALTERGEPWPKAYNFRTPPRFAAGLLGGRLAIVSLANNHSMDYGTVGLTDTIAALDAVGIRHAGAGANATEARTPVIVEANGLRVAFLAYVATPDEGSGFSIGQWAAGPDRPGVAIGSVAAIAEDVAAARSMAEFVIVIVHAGAEYINAPDATQVVLANAALAAGADAYIGHHAHVVQPVDLRGNQLIAWGLGNFVFDLDPVDLANIPVPRVSLVLNITLTEGAGVTAYEAVPVTLDDTQDRPRPATPEEAALLAGLVGGVH